MKNKLIDLNNHLFAQMERLCDESVPAKKMAEEIERSRAVTDVAKRIIENGRLALDSIKERAKYTGDVETLPEMLEAGSKNGNGKVKPKPDK